MGLGHFRSPGHFAYGRPGRNLRRGSWRLSANPSRAYGQRLDARQCARVDFRRQRFSYSSRHQDWVFKIDYENGQGSGKILWRLGKDGDFQYLSSDPYPWFSHQHDASVDANGLFTVFDNGNTRAATDPTAHSRGQAIQLDQTKLTATLVVNADLGQYSIALGSAQKLPDGNYHYHLGDIVANGTAQAVEVAPGGQILYNMQFGEIMYRSFRVQDLYTPPDVASWQDP